METPPRFFYSRRRLNLKAHFNQHKIHYADYANIPSLIGILISRKMATLHELWTVYGIKDAHDMLEIIVIDDYNQRLSIIEKANK